MASEHTNFLFLAALGAGGLWLYRERSKHQREAKDARDELALAALGARVAPEPVPAKAPLETTPVRAEPAARAERVKLAPRSYDALFAQYGNGVPVAYLRALALRESGMNPRESDGPAWGLLQVVEVVRTDYNQRHGTRFERRDLLDPAVNIAIASDVLARIIDGYRRFHPEAVNLREDWANPLFVELLTFGWNAGFSERGGVGRVATHLAHTGFTDFTIDDVHTTARKVGASPHLSNPKKVAFSKRVVVQYLREKARDEGVGYEPPAPTVVAEAEPVTQPSQVDGETGGVA